MCSHLLEKSVVDETKEIEIFEQMKCWQQKAGIAE